VTAARAAKGNPAATRDRGQVWQTIFFQGAYLSQFDGVTHKSHQITRSQHTCSRFFMIISSICSFGSHVRNPKRNRPFGDGFYPQTELLQARSARIRGVNAKDRGWRPTWPEEAENTNLMGHEIWDYSGYVMGFQWWFSGIYIKGTIFSEWPACSRRIASSEAASHMDGIPCGFNNWHGGLFFVLNRSSKIFALRNKDDLKPKVAKDQRTLAKAPASDVMMSPAPPQSQKFTKA
jgi:hypothetical protein